MTTDSLFELMAKENAALESKGFNKGQACVIKNIVHGLYLHKWLMMNASFPVDEVTEATIALEDIPIIQKIMLSHERMQEDIMHIFVHMENGEKMYQEASRLLTLIDEFVKNNEISQDDAPEVMHNVTKH